MPTVPSMYMGDHPVLLCRVDPYRCVDSGGGFTDRLLPPKVALHWVVAVVVCPYCGGEHEHHMAARVGWGYYRAGCSKLGGRGYYLVVTE
jgi:hypothetical protein